MKHFRRHRLRDLKESPTLFGPGSWELNPPWFARILLNVIRIGHEGGPLHEAATATIVGLVSAGLLRLSAPLPDASWRQRGKEQGIGEDDRPEEVLEALFREFEEEPARSRRGHRRDRLEMLIATNPSLAVAALRRIANGSSRGSMARVLDEVTESIRLVSEVFDLDDIEKDILHLAVSSERVDRIDRLLDKAFEIADSGPTAIGALLGHHSDEVARRIAPQGRLTRSGLCRLDHSFTGMDLEVGTRLLDALSRKPRDAEELMRWLLGEPLAPSLTIEDFPHLAGEIRRLVALLRTARRERRKGINIILYGPPGTGKTELAKLVAHEAGHPLFGTGATDKDGDEMDRTERIQTFRLIQSALATQRAKGLCLFDEADDAFRHFGHRFSHLFGRPRDASRIFANSLFEENEVPGIWIVNDPRDMPDTVIRRAKVVLHVDTPPPRVRRRIIVRIAESRGMALAEEEIERLAQRFPVPPALVENAIESAMLAGEGGRGVENMLEDTCRILGIRPRSAAHLLTDRPFRADLAEADRDLDELMEQIEAADARPISLCLHGVPGTGKSAFAAALGCRLGFEIEKVRASDLLSPYVGMTEKLIQRAFERAARGRLFLIIDEADSFLRNRGKARYSWEVSQVNELLVAMENHPLPFVCTTNLVDSLDEAALRRFTFDIRFDTLPLRKAEACFRHFFDMEPPPGLATLEGLVPADFANVRRRAEILGTLEDPEALIAELEAEIRKRRGHAAHRPIGFAPH